MSRLSSLVLYFSWYCARGVSTFVLPLFLNAIGMPIVAIGIALGISGASLLIFEAVWGFVLDRFGVAKTLLPVAALAVATFLLFPFVVTPEEAYVAAFFLGMTSPVMVVIGRTLTVGQSQASSWGAGFGLLGAAVSLGFGSGALLGGFVSSSIGFASAFVSAALLSSIAYPLYLTTRRMTGSAGVPQEISRPEMDSGEESLDWRTVVVLGLVSIPLFMGSSFYTGLMQLVVTKTPSIGASETDAAIMVAFFSLANVIFQPLLGWRLGARARSFIPVGLLLNFVVFIALMFVSATPGFDVLAILEGLCFSMVSPLSLSLLMVRMPRRYSGRVMGIYGAAEDVGIILGPVVGAFVWVEFGVQNAFLAIALPLLAAFVFYLVSYRGK